jgi:cytochrome c-type biogenesis protein CcmE
MGERALESRLRVGGDVETGSIVREGKIVRFVMTQDNLKLNVVYTGTDPLPDTFRDSSQALADGRMRPDGTFEATRIQAKCASKYEGKPQYKVPATQTTNKASL